MKKLAILSIAALGAIMLLESASAGAADAPNALKMQEIHFLVGSWDCTWHAGPSSGKLVSTFTPVMNGAWLQQTEEVQGAGGSVVTTMHFSGYDPTSKLWIHVGPNADGTYEVATSPDFRTFHNVHPEDMSAPATLVKTSDTELSLSQQFTQDGKQLTYVERCLKR